MNTKNVRLLFIWKLCAILFLSGNSNVIFAQVFDTDVPMGFASKNQYGVESTTGGGNGAVVVARTKAELANYAGKTEPLVIMVEGTITGGGAISIKSNKTIIGAGSGATLINVELNVSSERNVIIRNLTIKDGSRDAICTRAASHVWIDHCDLSNCGDGLLDVVRMSDLHCVSWVKFSNHGKTFLINNGTSQPQDDPYLNTTIHHAWFNGSDTRNPRCGYGDVHIFNCMYNNNDYGIGLHSQTKVYAEKNYFESVKNPIQQMYRPDPTDIHHGFCESVDNVFDKCTGKMDDEGISFDVSKHYMWNFMVDPVNSVPSIVKSGAGTGAQWSKLGLMPTPGQGAIKVTSQTLKWTKGQGATSYIVYFGTTVDPPKVDTTSSTSFVVDTLIPGTIHYWRVDQVTSEDTVVGKLWHFRSLGDPLNVTLNTTKVGNGLVSPLGGTFEKGSVVKMAASSTLGWKFEGWSGDVSSSSNLISLFMDTNKSITATFIEVPVYTLTTSKTGNGVIYPVNNSQYSEGDVVTISAVSYSGYYFDGWGGDLSGNTNPVTLTMDGNKTITATFSKPTAINDFGINQGFEIFPVPVKDVLHIKFKEDITEKNEITLLDATGRILNSGFANGRVYTLNMDEFPGGMYMIKINGLKEYKVVHISKQ
ncbi:MAG: T9SS type A sorting domain-containing protein [Bacteroidales bacterium]